MRKKILSSLALLGGGIAIVATTLVANYFLMAWTEPTLPPPGGIINRGEKYCRQMYASPSFASVSNSHGTNTLVPSTWSEQNCSNLSLTFQGGSNEARYQLLCVFADGTISVGMYGTAGLSDGGFPVNNCGW